MCKPSKSILRKREEIRKCTKEIVKENNLPVTIECVYVDSTEFRVIISGNEKERKLLEEKLRDRFGWRISVTTSLRGILLGVYECERNGKDARAIFQDLAADENIVERWMKRLRKFRVAQNRFQWLYVRTMKGRTAQNVPPNHPPNPPK